MLTRNYKFNAVRTIRAIDLSAGNAVSVLVSTTSKLMMIKIGVL